MFRIFQRDESADGDALVQDMAANASSVILQQLNTDIARMSVAELRGYVRARALQAVCARASELQGFSHERSVDWSELIAAAVDRTVQNVVRDRWAPLVTSIPAPHVQSRAA